MLCSIEIRARDRTAMAFSNHWALADGTLNDKPIEIRYRDQILNEQESGEYGQCVQIAWNAESSDPVTGFPSVEEMNQIDAFNQRLMEVVEADEHGILVMVLTSQGINQWILYCRDLEQTQQDLNRIPTDQGLYPIEVVAEEDSAWETFTQLRDAIKAH